MKVSVPCLALKGQSSYFRIAVPKDLKKACPLPFGKRERFRTLSSKELFTQKCATVFEHIYGFFRSYNG